MSGHEWSWVVLGGLEWSWVVMSGHEWSWVVMSGLEWSWMVLNGLPSMGKNWQVISLFYFQRLNSKTKVAELTLWSQCTHPNHQRLLKAMYWNDSFYSYSAHTPNEGYLNDFLNYFQMTFQMTFKMIFKMIFWMTFWMKF